MISGVKTKHITLILQEAVTGMVRRKDAPAFCQNVVLGVLPVGYNNYMAKTLFPESDNSLMATHMAEATMSVIRQHYRPIDVMEIENINEEDPEFHGKKLHGLRQIQFGAFRDSHERINNYWFLPGIKKYVAHLFSYTTAAKHILWNISGTLENITREDTDSNTMKDTYTVMNPIPEQHTWKDYLFYFWPSQKNNRNVSALVSEIPEHVTEKVNMLTKPIKFDSSEVTIQSNNDIGLCKDKSDPLLQVTLGPENTGLQEFLAQAWRRQWNNTPQFQASSNIEVDKERWRIFPGLLSTKWKPTSTDSNENTSSEEKYFYLDGEPIEFHGGMEVTMLPNKLRMFCADSLHVPFIPINYIQSDNQKKWWQRKSNIQSNAYLKR